VVNPDSSLHHRKNLRIPEFDYSQPGAYFVTIVAQERKQLFGHIIDGEMVLNEVGRMVTDIWAGIPSHFPNVELGEFVVMPNHIHGIISITVEATHAVAAQDETFVEAEQLSLPEIVHRIKSLTTHRYMLGVRDKSWPRFEKHLWQRNYYEHVIRNERDYQAVYDYIIANPMNWDKDEENPT